MSIIKPTKLQKGDAVGIISPSEPVLPSLKAQYDKGIATLESFGLKVKLGKHVLDQYFYNAGTREDRISDFNEIWQYPEVKMILTIQGGETANHLLDGIDYEMIKNNPKIFAGISDGTTLLNAIYAKTGLVTYHGPDLIWTFGREITDPYKENMLKTWFNGDVGQLHENPQWQHQDKPEIKYEGWKAIRSGKASGVLVGGHSDILISTMLAGYGPDFQDTILFLEGTNNEAELDRHFTALKLNGVFDKINGLVLGWFDNWNPINDPKKERKVSDVLLEVTNDYSFPILQIGECGHNVENYILPIGCKVTINADKKYFSVDELTVL